MSVSRRTRSVVAAEEQLAHARQAVSAHDDQLTPALSCHPKDLLRGVPGGDENVDVDRKQGPVLESLVEEPSKFALAVVRKPCGASPQCGRLGQQRVVDCQQRELRPEALGYRGCVAQRRP